MAFFSSDTTHPAGHSSFASTLIGLRARAVAAWQLHRAERALESLSYETLKDIGFPSADRTNKDKPAR